MRIKQSGSSRDTIDRSPRPASPVPTRAPGIFAAELEQQQTQTSTYGQELLELQNQIEKAGERLENEPTLQNFKEFRELLSRLAKRINGEAYRLEKIGGTPQNPRYYEIIRIIDTEADKLYNLVVQQHRDRMAITAKVIGIKGLVVDLIT